jgi:hypothetical protein
MFQQNGKFVRKIGKHKCGLGEYGLIRGFDVIRDTIYISSTGRRSFLRYTFDGALCNEIQLNFPTTYFNNTSDQKLMCYDLNEGKLYVYNKNYSSPDTIIVEFGVSKGRYYYMYGNPLLLTYLQKTPDGLLFRNYVEDTVWNIIGDRKEPVFILDMKNKLPPRDKQFEFCNANFEGWVKMVKSYQYIHLIPFSSWIFAFQIYWTGTEYDAINLRNNETSETDKLSHPYINDDIVDMQRPKNVYFIYSPDYLVTLFESQKKLKDLKIYKASNKEMPSLL